MARFPRIRKCDSRLLFMEGGRDSRTDERRGVGVFRAFPGAQAGASTAQPSQGSRRGVLVDANWRSLAGSARGVRRLEFHLAAISSLGRQRHLGCDPGSSWWKSSIRNNTTNNRRHHHPGAPLRSRRKGGFKGTRSAVRAAASRPRSTPAPTPMACRSVS